MRANTNSHLPPVPLVGRAPRPDPPSEPQNLWRQLLAKFVGVSTLMDPFANDSDEAVRTLGRVALRRTPRAADDYFALGDMCAHLTLSADDTLNASYAEKALQAFQRAGESSPGDDALARRTILAFVFWVGSIARMLATYEALQISANLAERTIRLDIVTTDSPAAAQLHDLVTQMRAQIALMLDEENVNNPSEQVNARLSRRLCDEGQVFLRNQRTPEALQSFTRALEADPLNSTAWLWQALAQTDVARFKEAIVSYDRAIELDPTNYGALNSKGALLMEIGRVGQALECFEQALTMPLPPPIVKAAFMLNKGKALYILGRYEEARDALVRSDQLDPTPESAAGVAACNEMLVNRSEVPS